MKSNVHVFHTKHDFKPELGWAAFQLLAQIDSDGISASNLHNIAKMVGSALTQRSDLNKLLASMQDVGLIEKTQKGVVLSVGGRALTKGIGGYEVGFRAAVHCLYAWKWIWEQNTQVASPSWSYRQVLGQILRSGSVGIDPDEIVLQLVSTAEEYFKAAKVSFSRSSVSGVTMWLESQALPLVQKEGHRIRYQNASTPTADSMRLHLAALCGLNSGEVVLDNKNMQLLAESVLIRPDELVSSIEDFMHDSEEFLLISAIPNRVIFKDTKDPFIEWIVKSAI
jgi:hypothetical protein